MKLAGFIIPTPERDNRIASHTHAISQYATILGNHPAWKRQILQIPTRVVGALDVGLHVARRRELRTDSKAPFAGASELALDYERNMTFSPAWTHADEGAQQAIGTRQACPNATLWAWNLGTRLERGGDESRMFAEVAHYLRFFGMAGTLCSLHSGRFDAEAYRKWLVGVVERAERFAAATGVAVQYVTQPGIGSKVAEEASDRFEPFSDDHLKIMGEVLEGKSLVLYLRDGFAGPSLDDQIAGVHTLMDDLA